LFERIKDGRVSLEEKLRVSERTWRQWYKSEGSKMFLEVGKEVKVEDLIRGIIVQSGNDASDVVAEAISGTVEAFADEMNRK
ncbi:MAG: D-alanyl-D-alanine carboxypeptidase, partial [Desulfuromonadales bacterium]|nr:D-alanyl-D-alanine carboxypeptidase [Desulfuromonadales bacterium]NIS42248.1 D-alanyl-D-alanine carboxypeptidase [Desulfuromonadales bacterium]